MQPNPMCFAITGRLPSPWDAIAMLMGTESSLRLERSKLMIHSSRNTILKCGEGRLFNYVS
jgi:hypothetical protein